MTTNRRHSDYMAGFNEGCKRTEEREEVIAMGHGRVEVGAAIKNGLPALWFGNDGQGMGFERERSGPAKPGETLIVFTFANLGGLEAIEAGLVQVRAMMEKQQKEKE